MARRPPEPISLVWGLIVAVVAVVVVWAREWRQRDVTFKVMPQDGDIYVSNCLIFAVGWWWTVGGSVRVRRSAYGTFPHFQWSLDGVQWWQFVPAHGKPYRYFPPFWFLGAVQSFVGEEPER